MPKLHLDSMTRRQALGLLGAGVAAATFPQDAFTQEPTFPQGAIIRTILKDYAPGDLAGGATLFHEHLQLGPDFNAKFSAASAAVRAANATPAPAPRGGGAPAAGAGNAGRGGGGGVGGGGGR